MPDDSANSTITRLTKWKLVKYLVIRIDATWKFTNSFTNVIKQVIMKEGTDFSFTSLPCFVRLEMLSQKCNLIVHLRKYISNVCIHPCLHGSCLFLFWQRFCSCWRQWELGNPLRHHFFLFIYLCIFSIISLIRDYNRLFYSGRHASNVGRLERLRAKNILDSRTL